MLTVAGEDATEYFDELHKPQILDEYGDKYIIGEFISSKLVYYLKFHPHP